MKPNPYLPRTDIDPAGLTRGSSKYGSASQAAKPGAGGEGGGQRRRIRNSVDDCELCGNPNDKIGAPLQKWKDDHGTKWSVCDKCAQELRRHGLTERLNAIDTCPICSEKLETRTGDSEARLRGHLLVAHGKSVAEADKLMLQNATEPCADCGKPTVKDTKGCGKCEVDYCKACGWVSDPDVCRRGHEELDNAKTPCDWCDGTGNGPEDCVHCAGTGFKLNNAGDPGTFWRQQDDTQKRHWFQMVGLASEPPKTWAEIDPANQAALEKAFKQRGMLSNSAASSEVMEHVLSGKCAKCDAAYKAMKMTADSYCEIGAKAFTNSGPVAKEKGKCKLCELMTWEDVEHFCPMLPPRGEAKNAESTKQTCPTCSSPLQYNLYIPETDSVSLHCPKCQGTWQMKADDWRAGKQPTGRFYKNAKSEEYIRERIAEYDARTKNPQIDPAEQARCALIRDAWQKDLDAILKAKGVQNAKPIGFRRQTAGGTETAYAYEDGSVSMLEGNPRVESASYKFATQQEGADFLKKEGFVLQNASENSVPQKWDSMRPEDRVRALVAGGLTDQAATDLSSKSWRELGAEAAAAFMESEGTGPGRANSSTFTCSACDATFTDYKTALEHKRTTGHYVDGIKENAMNAPANRTETGIKAGAARYGTVKNSTPACDQCQRSTGDLRIYDRKSGMADGQTEVILCKDCAPGGSSGPRPGSINDPFKPGSRAVKNAGATGEIDCPICDRKGVTTPHRVKDVGGKDTCESCGHVYPEAGNVQNDDLENAAFSDGTCDLCSKKGPVKRPDLKKGEAYYLCKECLRSEKPYDEVTNTEPASLGFEQPTQTTTAERKDEPLENADDSTIIERWRGNPKVRFEGSPNGTRIAFVESDGEGVDKSSIEREVGAGRSVTIVLNAVYYGDYKGWEINQVSSTQFKATKGNLEAVGKTDDDVKKEIDILECDMSPRANADGKPPKCASCGIEESSWEKNDHDIATVKGKTLCKWCRESGALENSAPTWKETRIAKGAALYGSERKAVVVNGVVAVRNDWEGAKRFKVYGDGELLGEFEATDKGEAAMMAERSVAGKKNVKRFRAEEVKNGVVVAANSEQTCPGCGVDLTKHDHRKDCESNERDNGPAETMVPENAKRKDPYWCSCGKTFKDPESFDQHMANTDRSHQGHAEGDEDAGLNNSSFYSYVCPSCVQKGGLQAVAKEAPNVTEQNQCALCHKALETGKGFRIEDENMNSKENAGKMRCSCGGSISVVQGQDDRWECDDCGQLFESDDWRKDRLKAVNAKENSLFIFTDQNGDKDKVTATDEEAAWQEMSRKWATPMKDLRTMLKVERQNSSTGWESGTANHNGRRYTFSAKVYEEGSDYGINGGRISKLLVKDSTGKEVVVYERGWDVHPTDDDAKTVLDMILRKFPG